MHNRNTTEKLLKSKRICFKDIFHLKLLFCAEMILLMIGIYRHHADSGMEEEDMV